MTKEQVMAYDNCIVLLGIMESALNNPEKYHPVYIGMTSAQARKACRVLCGAFPSRPIFDVIGNIIFSIKFSRFRLAGEPEMVMELVDSNANKEIYIIYMPARSMYPKLTLPVYDIYMSIENYNRNHIRDRYGLLMNYPAGKMMIMDRDTLEEPEEEVRKKFFGLP